MHARSLDIQTGGPRDRTPGVAVCPAPTREHQHGHGSKTPGATVKDRRGVFATFGLYPKRSLTVPHTVAAAHHGGRRMPRNAVSGRVRRVSQQAAKRRPKPAVRLYHRITHALLAGLFTCLASASGCGSLESTFSDQPTLFSVPLEIVGHPVEKALVDTGGGFEVMLRDDYGLTLIGRSEVLAFGGIAFVGITEAFPYSAGGYPAKADLAIVGASICDCNGLGYHFFRKTGVVLGLDFTVPAATFVATVPKGGVTIPFAPPPRYLDSFESSFVEVEIRAGGSTERVVGLLDTGAPGTVMRRGLIGSASPLIPDRVAVTVTHEHLGSVAVNARLFDTPGLPELILGLDVMRAWGDRWYFSFVPGAGTITVISDGHSPPES